MTAYFDYFSAYRGVWTPNTPEHGWNSFFIYLALLEMPLPPGPSTEGRYSIAKYFDFLSCVRLRRHPSIDEGGRGFRAHHFYVDFPLLAEVPSWESPPEKYEEDD